MLVALVTPVHFMSLDTSHIYSVCGTCVRTLGRTQEGGFTSRIRVK